MIAMFKKFLTENWNRKIISLLLATITWILVTNAITVNKTIHNIPIKIINLPSGKTLEGIEKDGTLNKKLTLTLSGNKTVIDEITAADLEVVIDATNKGDEWIEPITKKNLRAITADVDLNSISKISHSDLILRLSKLVTEKIPITLSTPNGEAPKGFQFLDIWPRQLYVSVSGPEGVLRDLKMRGLKLVLNLNDVSENDLAALKDKGQKDELSFPVPLSWKKISIPELSANPFVIDDPRAKNLHIYFVQKNLLPLNFLLPVNIFFPLKYSSILNPDTYSVEPNDLIQKQNGMRILNLPLYTKGVSRLFLDSIQERVALSIIAAPKNEKDFLNWSIEFISPQALEDTYVAKALKQVADESERLDEESLRSRFRSYLNSFSLFREDEEKLSLKIELKADTISITTEEGSLK